MQFTVADARPVAAGAGTTGVRVPVTAVIGTTRWAKFHVDLGEGVQMTGTPDAVPALTITPPGLDPATYRAYPLVDHVADKTCAILERHGQRAHPSARFKDLVDLVALVQHIDVTAAQQRHALQVEASRRATCRSVSTSRTGSCGSEAMPRLPNAPRALPRARSTTPSPSCAPSSTRCSTTPPEDDGPHRTVGGHPDRRPRPSESHAAGRRWWRR